MTVTDAKGVTKPVKAAPKARAPRVVAGARDAEIAAADAHERSFARDFRRLAGHVGFVRMLNDLSVRDALPQVLLLTGRAGIGKAMIASNIAALHLCEHRTACGTCDACLQVASGSHPELLLLDDEPDADADAAATAKPKLSAADAAAVQEQVAINPGSGARARVVIVEDIDRLTASAANRLLKTLEEPPPAARFVLTSSRPRALLATIRSRTVQFRVRSPEPAAALKVLRDLVAASDVTGDAPSHLPAEADILAELARFGGSPGLLFKRWQAKIATSVAHGDLRTVGCPKSLLDALERSGEARGQAAGAWLEDYELTLNRYYRDLVALNQVTSSSTSVESSPAETKRRRELLGAARRKIGFSQIALSSQLLAEATLMERRWTV